MKRNYLRIRLNLLLTVLVCFTFLNLAQGVNLDSPTINIGEEYLRKQEQVTITGTVTDENGLSLPGVNVVEKGTTLGTITDGNGKFSLKVSGPQAILVFSFIGYATQEVQIGNQTQINISLTPDIESLDEVVIVGYGTQKKATLSGSVASVKGETIAKSPAMNITNSIASTIPGLVAVGQSGEPGSDYSTLYIRGRSSLNDNSPLVVVDGVPNRSLERIDPASIESISVLKDASAAIYGSQAANGVILVTTKRGSTDKLVFTANYTSGWSQPTRVPELTNAAEYAQLVNEIDYYDNRTATYSDSDIEQFANGTDLWRYPNSDWYKLVLKPWSMQSNANLTMSGGNEKIQSFVSVSTRQQDGFYKQSANKYAQHDLRINNDFKVNDYISTSLDASFRLEQRKFPTTSSAAIFRDLMTALPIQVAYWPNGLPGPPLDVTSQNNPAVLVTSDAGTNQSDNYVFNANAKINIKIPWVKGLSVSASGAFDRGLNYSKNFTSKYDLYAWDKTTVDADNVPVLTSTEYGTSNLKQQLDISKSYLVNAIATYQHTIFGIHDVNIVAGVETFENTSNWFAAERRDFAIEFPAELNFGNSNQQYANGSNPGANRWLNYFGRVNYTLKDRYIAEFVWRNQGSSKFHPDTRWGFFTGISLAYRISEEDFWKDSRISSIINNFKIRTSWGNTGNDLIEPYQYYSLYSLYWQYFVTDDGVNHPTYYESKTGNTKSQWEEARQANIGADLTFFNSKLTFSADYFNNLRTKILIPPTASVPDMTGLTGVLPDINLGKVRNHGFDFEALWADHGGNLNYRIGINGCYAKNKVLFFDEAEGALDWQKKTGHPMYSGLYYEAIGIFHTQEELDAYPHMAEARTGDVIFKDVNGDGEITGDDIKRIDKSSVPTLTGGLSVSMEYRGFDVSLQIQGQAGAVRYLQNLGGKNVQNYLKSFYDNRWTEENPNADYPRTFNRNDEYWVSSENHNTFWLRKTDFIRLKNMELGYNLPETLVTRLGLTSMRIYVGGMNLLTFSPDIKDYDPELEPKGDGFAGQGYPLQKIITTGISIKF
ncbi:MAG: TonB-dependent receptor [Salinivirgaceae bacterium]|nr:TonB-dependent receptor [Salinivirgaceae bacterium]